jgi:hypothetical protein
MLITLYFLIGLAGLLLDDTKVNLPLKNKILYVFIWPIPGLM